MKTYSVIWTEPAIVSLRDIHQFLLSHSAPYAKQIITDLVTLGNSLSTLPYRFPIEPLLLKEVVDYRFASQPPYKVIYTVEDSTVLIVEVFDTRQDPKKLKVNR